MSPDIAMCSTKGCPLASSCYRKQATPDRCQTYSNFKYQDGECNAYWEIKTLCHKCKRTTRNILKMGGLICEKCRTIKHPPFSHQYKIMLNEKD